MLTVFINDLYDANWRRARYDGAIRATGVDTTLESSRHHYSNFLI
jgi:hypothetical protein